MSPLCSDMIILTAPARPLLITLTLSVATSAQGRTLHDLHELPGEQQPVDHGRPRGRPVQFTWYLLRRYLVWDRSIEAWSISRWCYLVYVQEEGEGEGGGLCTAYFLLTTSGANVVRTLLLPILVNVLRTADVSKNNPSTWTELQSPKVRWAPRWPYSRTILPLEYIHICNRISSLIVISKDTATAHVKDQESGVESMSRLLVSNSTITKQLLTINFAYFWRVTEQERSRRYPGDQVIR